MRYRVYYNRRGAHPWSVDDGNQATERTCAGVMLCKCFWQTKVLSDAERALIDPSAVPSAWIEVEASRAERIGERIVFVP